MKALNYMVALAGGVLITSAVLVLINFGSIMSVASVTCK